MTARFCMRNKSSIAGPSPPRLGPVTDAHTTGREAKARRMEDVIRGYFDACNTGDADAVATYFAPGAVHYFPPDMYEGPFRGGETIGAKWSWAVRTLGSHWTVDQVDLRPGHRPGGDRVDAREDQGRRGAAR